jgi:hypothetical protein
MIGGGDSGGNDSLRLLELRGGVFFCFYYTDPKLLSTSVHPALTSTRLRIIAPTLKASAALARRPTPIHLWESP